MVDCTPEFIDFAKEQVTKTAKTKNRAHVKNEITKAVCEGDSYGKRINERVAVPV